MLRDVAVQGLPKSRRIKDAEAYFVPEQCPCSYLRGTARKTGVFREEADCNGVMVMPQRTGGMGCLYRHTHTARGANSDSLP